MKFDLLDFTSTDPYFDIALEEVLFRHFESRKCKPFLRLWSPKSTYVVLGTGQKVKENVDVEQCEARGVPIIRRFSGGGTVVHSNGQLCFSFFLPYSLDERLEDVCCSYRYVFEVVAELLLELRFELEYFPPSDFAIGAKKISGNASRRGRYGILHHGTLLINSKLSEIFPLLTHPPAEPDYRNNRPHESFLTTLSHEGYSLGDNFIKEMFANHLRSGTKLEVTSEMMQSCMTLVEQKYNTREWNFKR